MNLFLVTSSIFILASIAGWVLEVFWRRFISKANPKREWINPGFLSGPWLPLYGFGTILLFFITFMEDQSRIANPVLEKVVFFCFVALVLTLLEFITGLFFLKFYHLRLWDYSNQRGNIMGLVCPRYSLFWWIIGAVYYFYVHPRIIGFLTWLSEHLATSFVIGIVAGIYLMDAVHSFDLGARVRKFAAKRQLDIRLDEIRERARQQRFSRLMRIKFFFKIKAEEIEEILEKSDQN